MDQKCVNRGVESPPSPAAAESGCDTPPATASLTQLKRLLESGAVIRERLQRVTAEQATCGGKHPLNNLVDHWLGHLAAAIRKNEAQGGETARVELRSALYDRCYEDASKLDGFRYAILVRDGQFAEVCRRWESSALNAILRCPATYQFVPREWLPTAFRERLESMLEDQAYYCGSNATAAADWGSYLRHLQRARQDPARAGLATGLRELDVALGGLRGICFLAGGPGVGKSCLSLALALGVLRNHADVCVLLVLSDLGMSKTVVYTRLLSAVSGLPFRKLLAGDRADESERRVQEADLSLRRDVLNRLKVVEPGERPLQTHELLTYLATERARLLQASGSKRVLTIIDHFHALRMTNPAPDGAPPVDENRARMSALQELQRRTRTPGRPAGDPFLVLGEVRKGDSGRGRLTPDDILGSAEIAYAADAICLLEEGKDTPPGGGTDLVLRVAKVRDGGLRGDVALHLDPTCGRIAEASAAPRARQRVNPSRGKTPGFQAIDPLAGAEGA